MNRSLAYYRDMRARKIAHRKYIDKERSRAVLDSPYHIPWYTVDGRYDKGKIHCSCGMCARWGKTNNRGKRRRIHGNYAPSKNWSPADQRKRASMDSQVNDYINHDIIQELEDEILYEEVFGHS